MKAIHCTTQNEFDKVLEIFEKKEWKWYSGDTPTNLKDVWLRYKENTCLEFG